MNISPVGETFLSDAGHEALHWSNIGDINATDDKIMEWGNQNQNQNQFIVFTHDLDFSDLHYLTGATSPSVFQVRIKHIIPSQVGELVLKTIDQTEKQLLAGALLTLDPRKKRIRLLPLAK